MNNGIRIHCASTSRPTGTVSNSRFSSLTQTQQAQSLLDNCPRNLRIIVPSPLIIYLGALASRQVQTIGKDMQLS